MCCQSKEQQQQRNALKHCQRIKAVYNECRCNLPLSDSYTHIPDKLWEVIETMLNDETLPPIRINTQGASSEHIPKICVLCQKRMET